jgi:hypothetical protein
MRDESIGDVRSLCEAARKPYWLKNPADNGHALIGAAGEIQGEKYIPPRSYQAHTVSGLVDAVRDLASIDPNNPCRIFVGRNRVTAFLDEREDRRHKVSLDLMWLESFSRLARGQTLDDSASDRAAFDQKQLIDFLRWGFPGRVAPASFTAALSTLKFTTKEGGAATVKHGAETVDLSIEREIVAVTGKLDETIVLSTPVFDKLAMIPDPPLFEIACLVRMNVQDRTFAITPLEGQVDLALRNAMEWIRANIAADNADRLLPENVSMYPQCSPSA